ncbi:MAG: hypothetical protein ABJI96_21285 [Paracoccaceae bacterium]
MTFDQIEHSKSILIAAFSVAAMLGLSKVSQAQTDPMTHPINCATAEGDIRALNAEKTHAQDQQLEDVAAITPAGALLGLIQGDEPQKLKML